MDVQTASPEARRRAGVFAAMSLAYHAPPDEGLLARFSSCAAEAAPSEWSDMQKDFSDLARLASETPRESLRQDFDDLFRVPGSKYVTPYESVYLDGPLEINGRSKARTCGPSMQAVSAFYSRIGLEVVPGYPELRDYIGLELSCMEYLCARETGFLEAGDESSAQKSAALQRLFLEEHLSRWFPGLEAAIREKAETEFYRKLASLTHEWLKRESGRPCPKGCPKG